ncbi:MAG: hypothetical protein C0P68_006385 [Bacillota bacterium]
MGEKPNWTPEKAYEKLREIYTDQLMQEEKRRVLRLLENRLRRLLSDLGMESILEPHEQRLLFFRQFAHIPGDSIFDSMQYVFNLARGRQEVDPSVTQFHLKRIFDALFTPPGLKNPTIPESFWQTPLGIACQVAAKGVESVYHLLDELETV